jgi:hypothetical protein
VLLAVIAGLVFGAWKLVAHDASVASAKSDAAPVYAPSRGLTSEGVAAVRALLAAHVSLAGVNAMAMDFGPGEGAAHDMVGTVERALGATHAQVQSLWRTAGLQSSAGFAWAHLGATVMLGVNDVTDERFTTADARELRAFAGREGIRAPGELADPGRTTLTLPVSQPAVDGDVSSGLLGETT